MASTGVLAGFGFFFWIIAAREFPASEVGIATTLISIAVLLANFALLGLNISLNRFLPKSEERNEMISSSSILVIIAAIVSSIIFLSGVNVFSPKLSFLISSPVYIITFIFFIVVLSLGALQDSVYIAYRSAGNIFVKNSILSVLKIIFIFLLVSFGAYGIFSSFTTAMAISFFISTGYLIYRYKFRPKLHLNLNIVRELGKYSLGNYIAGFLYAAPTLILPILILNKLHASSAAYYYIDSMILGILITIPLAVSQSLLTEGSHDEDLLTHHVRKAIKITYLFLVPGVIAIFIFGGFVLQFFGENYSEEAFRFLQIISLSSLFMPVVLFGNSILRIHHQIRSLIVLNLIGCIVVLGSSYALISYGLNGVGFGWLIGQIIIAVIFIVPNIKLILSHK